MNHFYFSSKQFLKILEKNNEILNLFSSIKKIDDSYEINKHEIVNVANDSSSQNNSMTNFKNKIRTNYKEILGVVRSYRPSRIFELINSFIIDLNVFDKSFNDNHELILALKEFPEFHTDAYSDKRNEEIFKVIKNVQEISSLICETEKRANFIIEEFDKSDKKSPIDYLPLRIGTDQDVPLVDDFFMIFQKIEGLYNFVCYIHKIDNEKKPLLINQLSTGSWYSELLGAKQAIISIENLLKGIGSFIRDYITGKIDREKFENECGKAEAFIKLMAIAKKNGIDNAQLKVFKELHPFVENFKSDTTFIEVNEEEILEIRETDKLTLLERQSKRDGLLKSINLLEEGKKPKPKGKTK